MSAQGHAGIEIALRFADNMDHWARVISFLAVLRALHDKSQARSGWTGGTFRARGHISDGEPVPTAFKAT